MTSPYHIEGFAIVSQDGMLANAAGVMPPELIVEADQRFFEDGLERMDAVVHGRHSQEQHRRSATRLRLIATRKIPTLQQDPLNPSALLWNPAGASFEQGLNALGVSRGKIGIIGGTDVFGLFLPHYTVFNLSRANDVRLPGGRPVFPQVPTLSPEDVLGRHSMKSGPVQVLDHHRNAALAVWTRT